MRKFWPLKNVEPMFPDEPGRYGFKRSHDVHTGVDLYCELGQEVIAIEDGIVVNIEPFTGVAADCGWWNDTDIIIIRGESGVIGYGEVSPRVKIGEQVKAGQTIAVVDTAVLKSFKGRPMVMLHLEQMTESSCKSPWWFDEKPDNLLNPEPLLEKIAGGDIPVFDLRRYDGKSFIDPSAPVKDSRWWVYWRKE